MMRRPLAALSAGLLAASLPAAVHGQSAPVPGATIPTQTYKDWALDCIIPTTGEGAGKQVCFIDQEAGSENDAAASSVRVVVRRADHDKNRGLIVEDPPNT